MTLPSELEIHTNTARMVHILCTECYPDYGFAIALCGTKLLDIGTNQSAECIICIELESLPCEKCGSL